MANLTLEIADDVLLKILSSAAGKKESLEAYLERSLAEMVDAGDEGMGLEEALSVAQERAKKRKQGAEFTLQELFEGDEWSAVSSPRWLGRKFRVRIEEAGIAQFVTKTATNKAIYKRT